jgi:hypothetical protein
VKAPAGRTAQGFDIIRARNFRRLREAPVAPVPSAPLRVVQRLTWGPTLDLRGPVLADLTTVEGRIAGLGLVAALSVAGDMGLRGAA